MLLKTLQSQFCFRGEWRSYQQRILDQIEHHKKDHKIHIVAPPGSGKTTLGIGMMLSFEKPCLILSPTLVIRSQWLERVKQAFLIDPNEADALLSTDSRAPAFLTSITYQTLYSCMNKRQGKEVFEELEEEVVVEVDYTDFDFIQTIKDAGIKTICLDECHHLRSEWWNALQTFLKEMGDVTIISLTATPPYDSTPAQWQRYIEVCGEIDEEIIVPELVGDGSLCPHQDYVYFNFPTKEEEQQIDAFHERCDAFLNFMMKDTIFEEAILTHRGMLEGISSAQWLLDDPSYLSSILIYLQQKNRPIKRDWYRLLGVKTFPKMSNKWMGILLQGFLFSDKDSYHVEESYKEHLITQLKREQLLHRNQVNFVVDDGIEKLLINSSGKLDSIKEIVGCEYASMKHDLRLLVLCDYIRKEFEPHIGRVEQSISQMGVLPIFELLRRAYPQLTLGVLCGSIVIVPQEALRYLQMIAPLEGQVLYDAQGNDLGYRKLTMPGKKQEMVQLVSKAFEYGYIEALVGTKSLLGEGWDSPCINALILASFVGSFVLSNQMRGRAIRAYQANPNKTSNIWHLVCIANEKEAKKKRSFGLEEADISEDFATFQRRMNCFLGVSYDGTTIENSIDRCDIIHPPYHARHVKEMNAEMKRIATQRDVLTKHWQQAMLCYDKMEVIEESKLHPSFLKTETFFVNVIGLMVFLFGIESFLFIAQVLLVESGSLLGFFINFAMVIFLVIVVVNVIGNLIQYLAPYRYLEKISNGIVEALRLGGLITSACKVKVEDQEGISYAVSLRGASAREQALFITCVEEFFAIIDNQRYLLYNRGYMRKAKQFYCVPSAFAKTKEDALRFQHAMKRSLGSYHLAYTRSIEGRAILMRARAKAFANRNDRVFDRKKKVTSVLE